MALIFLVMGFVAHSQPNYAAAQQALGVSPGPVITQKFVSQPLAYRVRSATSLDPLERSPPTTRSTV